MIEEKFGCAPEIMFYETPVVIDNTSNEVIAQAG